MKKLNIILTWVIYTCIAGFLISSVRDFWHYKANPMLYEFYSAPLYTGILVYGILALGIVLLCLLGKLILKYLMKKQ